MRGSAESVQCRLAAGRARVLERSSAAAQAVT